MHNLVKTALKDAITKCLPILQPLVHEFTETYLVWRKIKDQSWIGEYKNKPSLTDILSVSRKSTEAIDSEFLRIFTIHYPQYTGLVGCPSAGLIGVLHNPGYLLNSLLRELWNKHGTFQCSEDAIDFLIQEFEEFIDLPIVQFRYTAQLLNFHMDEQKIELPENLIIRQLSESEISEINGGSILQLGLKPSPFGIHEYALEGICEEPKIFGNKPDNKPHAYNQQLQQKLNRAILALRTFKEGRVGYDYIRFKAVKYCPLPLASRGYGALYIPIGQYNILKQEMQSLQAHASLIFSALDPSLEMACSRLADAQIRLRAQDRLVDAVIGLESLLLAGLRNEDRRGELKYRFALHYSTLASSPEERYQSFRVAKDLYDLRSTIAHGGIPNESSCRLGNQRVTLDQAAQKACEALRNVINHFLSTGKASYKDSQYWEKGNCLAV